MPAEVKSKARKSSELDAKSSSKKKSKHTKEEEEDERDDNEQDGEGDEVRIYFESYYFCKVYHFKI